MIRHVACLPSLSTELNTCEKWSVSNLGQQLLMTPPIIEGCGEVSLEDERETEGEDDGDEGQGRQDGEKLHPLLSEICQTRSLGALRASTSSWRPCGPRASGRVTYASEMG